MSDASLWVDPEVVAAGTLLREKGLVVPDRTVTPLAQVRAAQDRLGAFLGEGSVPLAGERDLSLSGPHGPIPCRLYLPDGVIRPGCLIYAHGSGFMRGTLDGWDECLRALVRQSGVAALSVGYKLSPEHKFPVALEEVVEVIRHTARDGGGLGIDPARLAVGGDSAGANLALVAALLLRDGREPSLRFQLLFYGVYSTDVESPSWRRLSGIGGLSQTEMRWIFDTYLESPAQQNDWRVAPLLADLAGTPPAHLVVGGLDPLLDDSSRLAARLTEAGVRAELTVYPGINHGFIRYGRLLTAARRAITDCAGALNRAMA